MKLYGKNRICILVIALNPKILYMRFLTAQLNRTLFKKFINMKDTQKCIKYQESWLFKANFCTEWVKSPLKVNTTCYNMSSTLTIPSLVTSKQRGEKILSWHHLVYRPNDQTTNWLTGAKQYAPFFQRAA